MAKKGLEKLVKKKVKPIVDTAMQRFIGITISELNKDISEKLEKSPLIDFEINTKIKFKDAKKMFKKAYLKKLLQISYGNISQVAKTADLDRRSIHRIIRKSDINVGKIREEMIRPYEIRQSAVTSMIEDVLEHYKEVIHPGKLEKVYQDVPRISKQILDNLPERPLTLKEAEEEFEREYFRKALEENGFNVALAAKRIGLRYETLHRKAKKLGIIA